MTNVDGLDGLDMGPGRVSWILLDQELESLVFWCFFWMALGEELDLSFKDPCLCGHPSLSAHIQSLIVTCCSF